MQKRNYRTGAPRAHPGSHAIGEQRGLLQPNGNLLNYDLIAAHVVEQFSSGNKINFDSLLAIPLEQRIPALLKEYGINRMQHVLYSIFNGVLVPLRCGLAKKKVESISRSIVSHIIISAESDFLSIEDIITFLHRSTSANQTLFVNQEALFVLLEEYRKERHDAYREWKTLSEQTLKNLGPVERIAGTPTSISELLTEGLLVSMSWKMSG